MSETLRIELEPLGVRVLTVITGFVATKIYENSPKKSLPNDSYYKAAENAVERTAVGPLAPNAKEDVRVYSENLANDIVGGRSGRILRGTQARTGYWATALLPTWLVVSCTHIPETFLLHAKAVTGSGNVGRTWARRNPATSTGTLITENSRQSWR